MVGWQWHAMAEAVRRLLGALRSTIKGEMWHHRPPDVSPSLGFLALELKAPHIIRDTVTVWLMKPRGFAAPVIREKGALAETAVRAIPCLDN